MSSFGKAALLILFVSAIPFALIAGNRDSTAMESIVTDRPDQTDASRTIPGGTVQIETGVIKENLTEDGSRTSRILYPTTTLRISILDNLEARIVDQFNYSNITYEDGSRLTLHGVENLAVGMKINICDEKGWRPETAFLSHLTLPVASSSYRNERVLADFKFSLSHEISSCIDWGCNLGWKEDDKMAYGTGTFSFEIGFKISAKLSAYAECYGEAVNFETSYFNTDAGLAFLVRNNLKIDCAFSNGVNITSHYFNLGFGWRLPG